MLQFFSKFKFLGVVLLLLSIAIISIIYSILSPERVLPVYQPVQVQAELVDSTIQHVKKYHTIGNFSLLNQNGETITQNNYNEKIYVADFFFTTCPTICPVMTDHMKVLQKTFAEDPEVLLLSHTVMPEVDSVPQLKAYALEHGVKASKWNLVTGEKKQIYDLARRSYLAAKDNPYDEYDLIHTENFVLVDKKKRIRGFYNGTDPNSIAQLQEDIALLKEED